MRVRLALLLSCLLLWALPAAGAETEVQSHANDGHCSLIKLCDAQTGTGTCGGAGNERYFRGKGFGSFMFFADTSASMPSDAFTIKIYTTTTGEGYSTNRGLVNSSDITNVNPVFIWSGMLGDVHAVIGGTNDSSITLMVKACMQAP